MEVKSQLRIIGQDSTNIYIGDYSGNICLIPLKIQECHEKATRIIKAVNSHDDLLAALEEIAAIPYSLNDRERGQINRIARAAIAKARG
jgi:hypothetical protein